MNSTLKSAKLFRLRDTGELSRINGFYRLDIQASEYNLRNSSTSHVHEKFVYEKRFIECKPRGSWIYRAQSGIWGSFFSYSAPGRGFGGTEFNLQMIDGSTEKLSGPWSSRCSVVNQMFPDRDELMEACHEKYLVVATITVKAVQEYITQNPECGFHLVRCCFKGDYSENRIEPWPDGVDFCVHGFEQLPL